MSVRACVRVALGTVLLSSRGTVVSTVHNRGRGVRQLRIVRSCLKPILDGLCYHNPRHAHASTTATSTTTPQVDKKAARKRRLIVGGVVLGFAALLVILVLVLRRRQS